MKPRFLIDENLPDDLADALGAECGHAIKLGERPTDDALWQYAQREDRVILTKDADFFNKLTLHGSPPKVIWIRTGNMRRIELIAFMVQQWPIIRGLLDQADLVEVHRDRIEAIRF